MAAECARTCVVALHRRARTAGSCSSSTFRTSPGTPATGRSTPHSVGIEHEGYTYGPEGFTDAQYRVVGPPRSLDRAPLADADRPEAHHRPRAGAGARRRPRRLVAPHRSGPALELAPVPPARAPLRGLREAERDATAPAGDAARRRPVAGTRRPAASRASSSRSTAAWSGSTGEPRLRSPAAAA